jgi:hypothetical protein
MLKSLTQQQQQQQTQQEAQPVYQTSLNNQHINRSARRQATLREKKQEMKEQKKYHKNIDNSARFNPKKGRKVVPLNPLVSMRSATIEKKATTTSMPKFTVTHIELDSEEIETLEEKNEFVQQQPRKDEQVQEELTKVKEENSTIECQKGEDETLSVKEEPVSETVTTATKDLSHPVVQEDILSVVIEENYANVNTNDAENADDDETFATIQEIKQPDEDPETPEPSMTSSSFDEDKMSPSTSSSSNKKKANLITRLFKHKNTSKKVNFFLLR